MDSKRGLEHDSPIFVVGVPRSGTTLMRFMLCAHPGISIAPETNYLNRWMRFYSHLDVRKPGEFEVFWEDFRRLELFPSFGIDPDSTLKRIRAAQAHDHRAIFACIAREYAARTGKARWGEKTPKHEHYLRVLLEWFPAARVIYLLRDPRAVAASLLSKDWGGSYVHAHAERWRKSSVRAGLWAKDDRVRVLQYEELVREPERVLHSVCDFLNERFTPAMIERSNVSDYVLYPGRQGESEELPILKPLNPASIDAWRKRLSSAQVSMIEHVAGDEMRRRGYQLVGEPLSAGGRGRLLIEKVLAPMESLAKEPYGRVLASRIRTGLRRLRS